MRPLVLLAVAVLLPAAAGCFGGSESDTANKAGGTSQVATLRLGDADAEDGYNQPVLTYFARQADRLSGGTLRIETTYAAAGTQRPDAEQEVARMVRARDLDLGYVSADAWDELGVRTLDGLFAPLLIDDDALLNTVAKGRLAARMLAGLRGAGVAGLALVPRSLGPPVGLEHPLRDLADFAGARVAVAPSKATDATLRALGARPEHVSELALSVVSETRIDAELPPLDFLPVADVVSANIPLLPKVDTLFVNPDSLHALSDDQRTALRRAAKRTVAHVISTRQTAQAAVDRFCAVGRGASPTGGGRAVLASPADLSSISQATRPVYGELRRNPMTRYVIDRITALKRSLPSASGLHLPAGCSTASPANLAGAKLRPASDLNGTYRWLLTKAEGRAAHEDKETLAGLPVVTTMTLRDGKWQLGDGPDRGTYMTTAKRISFTWPRVNSVLGFAYSADADGTLHLKPLPSVERGDRFIWSSQPWRRIGPPVNTIP